MHYRIIMVHACVRFPMRFISILKGRDVSWCILSALAIAAAVSLYVETRHSRGRYTFSYSADEPYYSADSLAPMDNKKILSDEDEALYRAVFLAQKEARFGEADKLLGQTHDPLLLGHALAQRYLSANYIPTFSELNAWLSENKDNPHAYKLFQLALARKPAAGKLDVDIKRTQPLTGYGDDASTMNSTLSHHAEWTEGLNKWKQNDYGSAYHSFSRLSKKADDFSSRDRAAIHFWAWRAAQRTGKDGNSHLNKAAKESRTLYGILAAEKLGRNMDFVAQPRIDSSVFLSLLQSPSAKRAVALAQIGETDLAERELRAAFGKSDTETKKHILLLTSMLDLPATEMRMAVALGSNGFDYALYPTSSRLTPKEGFVIDPALIFAFARQESGFHAKAKSGAGALGIMQIMPETANYIAKKSATKFLPIPKGSFQSARHPLSEPVANITLGQSYIAYLLRNKAVNGNLFYLAAAYNAGPGRVAEWKKEGVNDPLLFLETLPYAETRNYVTQVMTSYWIYAKLLGSDTASIARVANAKWPVYDASLAKL